MVSFFVISFLNSDRFQLNFIARAIGKIVCKNNIEFYSPFLISLYMRSLNQFEIEWKVEKFR